MILRIEDTDSQRFVPGAEEYIIESLKWCGIEIDEGVGYGGPHAPYRQSERREIYLKYAKQLVDAGWAYYAFDTAEELENIETGILDYTGYEVEIAKSNITNRGLKAIVVGNGKLVTGQVPESGVMLNRENGRVILYTDGSEPATAVIVPDVTGKTAEAANRILTNAGLNVSIGGVDDNADATVATQSIAPGTEVPEGTIVKVTLRSVTNVTDD